MPKTGLKTFVCSFALSLFTMFMVNGMFVHAPSDRSRDIKIPNKNIMLFLKDEAKASPSIRPAPLKKIALSVLPEVVGVKDIAPPQPQVLVPEDQDIKTITAEASEEKNNFTIPLEIGKSFDKNEVPEPTLKIAFKTEKLPPPPAILPRKKKEVPLPEGKELGMPKELLPIQQKLQIQPQKELLQVAASNADLEKKINNLLPPLPAPSQNKKAPERQSTAALAAAPQLIIPLEKGDTSSLGNLAKAKVVNEAGLSQVALADMDTPIGSMGKIANSPKIMPTANDRPSWEQMSGKPIRDDSPWVVAQGHKNAKNTMAGKNASLKKDDEEIKKILDGGSFNGGNFKNPDNEVEMASETVKNILIPIPEDILNDENLTPKLVSSKNEKEVKKEEEIEKKIGKEKKFENAKSEDKRLLIPSKPQSLQSEAIETPKAEVPKNDKSGILNSLSSIFSGPTNINKLSEAQTKENDGGSGGGFLSGLKKKLTPQPLSGKILPTEIRLSFQPGRAEISGQTLRWIQAFATKIKEDESGALEVRIDGTSAIELQQKRLNLLHNILTSRGVESSKINTVFTQREPNSFIIRTIKINNSNTGNINKNNLSNQGYYMQW